VRREGGLEHEGVVCDRYEAKTGRRLTWLTVQLQPTSMQVRTWVLTRALVSPLTAAQCGAQQRWSTAEARSRGGAQARRALDLVRRKQRQHLLQLVPWATDEDGVAKPG
jgi:hypothetical protein